MSITQETEIRSYVAAIETYLDDLPAEDRRELLDDVHEHLREVAAEAQGAPLVDRLGPPERYAAELRASAGLPGRDDRAPASRLAALQRRAERLTASGPVTSARSFAAELRPGWWVLRGYLVALVADALLFHASYGPIPSFGGSRFLGVVFVLACIAASVRIGRRTAHGRLRRPVMLANIALAVLLLPALGAIGAAAQIGPVDAYYMQDQISPYLHHEDGQPISNICAYDSKLRPIDRALLYDQDGKPIDNHSAPEFSGETVPGGELERGFGNAYPRPQTVVDPNNGESVQFACPTLGAEKSRSKGAEKGKD